MWHLKIDKVKSRETEYCKLLEGMVKNRISNINNKKMSTKSNKVYYLSINDLNKIDWNKINLFWNNNEIRDILKSEPNNFATVINEINNLLWNNEFENWKTAIDKNARGADDKNLIERYVPIVNYFKSVFDYDQFINDKKVSYTIADMIGINTCVYCNRQYIFTINNKKITRPEFDHYLPKSVYPFFALSLYNLIPSCHICNSNCKGTTKLDNDMNPYLTDPHKNYFTFTYHIDEKQLPSSVQIKDIQENGTEVSDFLETFKIREIYNMHTDLELKELYTFATKYKDTYLKRVLSEIVTNLKLSQEEAYRILFGTELFEDKNNDRPLSKFKRDILKELRVIK